MIRSVRGDNRSDIRLLLLGADFGLDESDLVVDLKVPAAGGRIDIVIGRTVIEVKHELTIAGVEADALDELARYLRTRHETAGGCHIGVLTDGVRWHFVHLDDAGAPVIVSTLEAPAGGHDPDTLIGWLWAIVGRTPPVTPTPALIEERLGVASLAHRLGASPLAELYTRRGNDPEVRLERELWAKLLRTARRSADAACPRTVMRVRDDCGSRSGARGSTLWLFEAERSRDVSTE